MSRIEHGPQTGSVAETAARLAGELAHFQAELADLTSKLIASPQVTAQAGERRWKRLCERRASADALFAELAEALEDWTDTQEAEKALAEPGEAIAWEDLKAELDPS